jgi:DNA-directed RNA polymerase subunit RPC12/RpoP
MSEFKFACPVCGQHITADSHAAGSQLECPTCFRKIVVPQGPSSTDPKFILSASEVNKPRPQSSPAQSSGLGAPPVAPNAIPVSLVLLVILICAIGTALFVVRGRIFRSSREVAPESSAPGAAADTSSVRPAPGPNPEPAKPSLWTLELTNMIFPTDRAGGKIHGLDFAVDRAVLQGGTLTLRRGYSGTPDLAINVNLFVNQPGQLARQSVNVATNDTGSPRVTVRWKEGGETMFEPFNAGYAMKLDFGTQSPSGLPGKIFLCLPDASNSWVAGTFNAEIRKPAAPRPPRTQKKRPTN